MPRQQQPPAAEPTSSASAPGSARAGTPDSGVDDTLIRWMLSLSPTERLQWAQDMVDTVEALREGRGP